MRPHFEKFLCQADAWHTAVLWKYIPIWGYIVKKLISISI